MSDGRTSMGSMPHALAALRHRNFRLFVAGQGTSLIGTFMTKLAAGWLVYRLTGSAMLLGVVSFVGQIVPFLLGPFAGIWIERVDRRRMLVWTQVAACGQSMALAVLTLSHVINLWEIVALAAVQGLINSLDTPGRQTFLVQMVEGREDLGSAIAINSAMTNGARLVGPALGGLLVAAVGEGWCFAFDAASYLAVIGSLLLMRVAPMPDVRRHHGSMVEQMREGWDYVRTSRPTRSVLLIFSLASLMGWPFATLLPVFASRVLHGGPHTLGWLTGSAAVGALASAVSLSVRKSVGGLPRMIGIAAGMLGGGLVLFGLSHTLWVSLVVLTVVGFGMMQVATASNTLIQSLVPDAMRGRVMSYYTMAFFGTAPFGSLLAGALAQHIGAPHTVVITGAACLGGCLWFSRELPRVTDAMRPPVSKTDPIPVSPSIPDEAEAIA